MIDTDELLDLIERTRVARDVSMVELMAEAGERLGIMGATLDRRVRRWRTGEATPTVEQADALLCALDLHLTDLESYREAPAEPAPRRRGGGHPAGVYGYLTDDQVRACHVLYMQGRSLRAIAAQIHPRTRYRSVRSCANALQQQFARLGLPRRDRIEATVLASTRHGLAPRGRPNPEHRRRLRIARGECLERPQCAGVRTWYPRKGERCQLRAQAGSDFCWAHDPQRAAEREAHMAEMRAKAAA